MTAVTVSSGRKRTILIAGICLLTAAVLLLTYRHVFLYDTFYGYREKPAGSVPIKILLAACVCALAFLASRTHIRPWQFLTLGVAVGTAMQFGFAYTEGIGFEGIRARALAGHGQFIAAALATKDAGKTVREYEDLAERGKLGQFPRSKPPGTLLFYVLTERVSRLFVAHTYDEEKRKDRFVDFLAMAWPVVATLAILPLYWLTTMLSGAVEARIAVGLYLLVPSFNLVTLHTDQVLFPFLFLVVLSLFVLCLRAKTTSALVVRGVAAGAALCLAVFCDFPLAVAVVLWAGLWLTAFVTDSAPRPARIRSTAMLAVSILAGLLVPSLVLWLAVNYNPIVRWQAAFAFHAAWRPNVPAVLTFNAGMSNIAEFVDWTGVPIALLALAVFRAGRSRTHIALMAALICLIGYLAFLSRTGAETARLWIFLMPVMCIVAARTLAELRTTNRLTLPIVFALQFATVYVIKVTHDFW